MSGDWRNTDAYINPDWKEDTVRNVHDWRNYIRDELRAALPTFTDEQKLLMAENADAIAGEEEWD